MKKTDINYFAYIAWLMASLFYFYQYILRVMPNIMLHDIMDKFNIDAASFGQFSGIYYIGYSLIHLPIGIMLDRFGPKKIMTGSILLTIIGLIPLVYSQVWSLSIIGRLLTGMGSSGAALGMLNIIRINFQEKRFTRMLSFSMTIGLTGAIYGGGPVNYLCNNLGYESVLKIFIFSGLILAILTYIFVKESKNIKNDSIIIDLKKVLFNKKILLACLFSGLMVGPLEGFADAWAKEFFQKVYGFNSSIGSNLTSLIFFGMWFGCPLLGYIAEKTDYLKTVIISGILMAISFILLLTGNLSKNTIGLMFIIVGVCCSYQILILYKVTTYVDKNISGLTTATTNMIVMSFGYAFHSIIGIIIKNFGNNALALKYGISIIPFTLILGFLGFLLLYKIERK